MPQDPYVRRCAVLRVIDGDTLRLRVDLGWNVFSDHNARLLGVNAPEMQLETRAAGIAAKIYVEGWVAEYGCLDTPGIKWPFTLRSEKDDSFGRYLVDLFSLDGRSLGDDLVTNGYATRVIR